MFFVGSKVDRKRKFIHFIHVFHDFENIEAFLPLQSSQNYADPNTDKYIFI